MPALIGTVQLFATPPAGWLLCDGQLLAGNNYQALFATIGFTYGGDGRSNFAVPNIPPIIPNGPAYYIASTGQLPQKQ
jgi:microcystin-dependent protein